MNNSDFKFSNSIKRGIVISEEGGGGLFRWEWFSIGVPHQGGAPWGDQVCRENFNLSCIEISKINRHINTLTSNNSYDTIYFEMRFRAMKTHYLKKLFLILCTPFNSMRWNNENGLISLVISFTPLFDFFFIQI